MYVGHCQIKLKKMVTVFANGEGQEEVATKERFRQCHSAPMKRELKLMECKKKKAGALTSLLSTNAGQHVR